MRHTSKKVITWIIINLTIVTQIIYADTLNYVLKSKFSLQDVSAIYFENEGIIRIAGRFLNHSDYAVKGRLLLLFHDKKQEVTGSVEVTLNNHNFIAPGKYADFEKYVRMPDGASIKRVTFEFIQDEKILPK